jgi:SAM-dependent methyltransferase
MRCIVCDCQDWENVDQFRIKKNGMSICKQCGFISYPNRWKKKEEIIEYYRKQYRPAPTVENLYQGQRKLHYHHAFLEDPVLKQWLVDSPKKDPVIFDVGAAFGMVLAWFKNMKNPSGALAFPQADLSGSELTLSYRRNAFHEYGIHLKEDFDDSKKYDLIVSYKVAEHILDVDNELVRYRNALKNDGYLYISVPTWFNRLTNFGATGFSIEYYYHPDHVNTWTREAFEFILKKSGFKVIKENHAYYDSAYLCVPGTWDKDIQLPGYAKIIENLARVKEADEFCQKKEFHKALETWPNFPIARRAVYEYYRKDWHAKGVDEIMKVIVKPWIKLDPDSYDAFALGADILMRYGKYDEALLFLREALHRRPKCETICTAIANCYRSLAHAAQSEKERINYITQARTMTKYIKDNSLNAFSSAVSWIYSDNASIPMPNEVS